MDVADRSTYLARWSALHGGYDPRSSRVVHGWLSLTYSLARPLARARVTPDALSVATALLASAAVVVTAAAGGRWLLLTSALVVVSGLADNLDGALAVLLDRATAWGFVLDSLCDRVVDAAYLVALWLAGAPAWLAVLGGALTAVQEYARARAGNAGMGEIGVVTVSERPTRVVVAAAFLLGAGLYIGAAAAWSTAGAVAWVAVHVVGTVQLLAVTRRRLRGSGAPHELGDDRGGHPDQGQPAAGMRRAADEEQPRHR